MYLHWQKRDKPLKKPLPHKLLKNICYYIHNSLQKTNKLPIFVAHWFADLTRGKRLKGNQVQILNSPAAVSSILCCKQPTFSHWKKNFREGARNRNKSEDLPCNQFHCFRGKSVESNEPDNSVYHFIHHSDSEKVCFNKLCQKFIYACPVEGISPGHF